jgi:tripartite-type tricarboxylate transporter receptor subunit TctC
MRRRALVSSLLTVPSLAWAQAYPDRPIRFIVPFPPGGGTDTWARIAADGMQGELGQPIIIENRGGAGGLLGTEVAAKAAPDGYTLLFTITTHVQTPVVLKRFPYAPVEDFAFIGRLGTSNTTFCVGPKVPVEITTWAAFQPWAKGRDLSFANYAPGSTGHAFGLMLAQEAGLQAEQVSYRGETPMLQDILSGSVHGGFHSMAAAGEMMKARRARPLASAGTRRIASLGDVPLLRELGFSDRFAFEGFSGLMAPVKTPAPMLARLDEAFRAMAQKPETIRRLEQVETLPAYLDPAAFRAHVELNLRQWTEITAQLNLSAEG